jgi:hypothetical protein
MQVKPWAGWGPFIKNLALDSENMFDVGLKPFCEFYKKIEIGLS